MIDHHAHPFALQGGTFDPSTLTLDVERDPGAEDRRRQQGPSRLAQELLTVRLAQRLGCEPEELATARAEASRDWTAYASALFRDAGITAILMDLGIAPGAEANVDGYAEASGCAIHPIMRIDPMVDGLISSGASAKEILDAVLTSMQEAAGAGAVGFKTILAYRTGLSVDPFVTLEQAEASLAGDGAVRRRGKSCRDLVFRRALGVAADLGLPFQIHTGFGDSELRLSESHPLLLEELLRTPEGSAAKIVLIHGSYPWHEEQAWLATTRPNVWAEVSLFDIFSPVTMGSRLLRWIDLAPTDKLIAGTDGHGEPEVFWFAAGVLREGWATVRATLTEAGVRESWLGRAERRIFEENARELYGV